MKKWLLIGCCAFFLTACTTKKEVKNANSIETTVTQHMTKAKESKEAKSSSSTNQTGKASSSSESSGSSATSESVDLEKQQREEKLEAYNNLAVPLKVLLATTIVDERAETPGLVGYGLGYNFDGGFLFVQIGSGAGTGHPEIKLSYDNEAIYPIEGIVREGAAKINSFPVPTAPVSKIALYDKYLNEKEKYDSSLSHVQVSENMTEANFEKLKALIGN